MIETFFATLSPMAVMLACMIIGYVMKKKNILPDNADKTISRLETHLCLPALMLGTFIENCTVSSIKSEWISIIYSIIAVIIAIIIAIPLSKVFSKDKFVNNIYKYSLVFANFGFMGNAIVPAILPGDPSLNLYKYLIFTLIPSMVVYTWGFILLVPSGNNTAKDIVKKIFNPSVIAILIGAAIGLLNLKPYIPEFMLTAVNYCKACMAPLAMILTGFVIASYNFKGLVTNIKVYILSLIRLVLLPAVILVLLKLLGATDEMVIFAFFMVATPTGLNTVVYPAAYGGDTTLGASMALISSVFCIVTIPLLYSLITAIL